MAFDPLSSQGIYKALKSGIQAAQAVRDHLSGDSGAFLKYASELEEHFDRHLGARAYYYARERRWPDSLFWKRRYADTIARETNFPTDLERPKRTLQRDFRDPASALA